MGRGRILAEGIPAALKAKSGAASLEAAFIALLPPERRGGLGADGHAPPPPATDGAEPVVSEAHGLPRRFGDFTAVDHVSLAVRRRQHFRRSEARRGGKGAVSTLGSRGAA